MLVIAHSTVCVLKYHRFLFKVFIFGFLLFPPFSKTDSILKIDSPMIATCDRTVLILF